MREKAASKLKVFPLALAAALALIVRPPAASARVEHHHVLPLRHDAAAAPAQPDSGFGPTAPGVSAILIDAGSGAVLFESGADIPRYPASLAKLMTLDLAFQALRDGRMSLDTEIPVSYHAATVEPVRLGLQPGDEITVRQAILAMTTMSANDAATALGEYLGGGSEYRCGEMMTLRAHVLGMAQSEFYNASGLPNPDQVSTARDLAILARDIVVNFPQDQTFFEVQQFDLDGHIIYSNNAMLKIYPGTTGMKTGYTILAKHNLITSAERNGRVLIGVVLHEPSWGETYGQMTALLDTGFGVPPGTSPLPPAPEAQIASNPPPVYTPPFVPPAPSSGFSVLPRADAATIRQPSATRNWTAQLGSFKQKLTAHTRAIAVREMRGIGIPRVAKIISHGRILWAAQLAGLTEPAADATCSALAARGDSCIVIAPSEHFASRDRPDTDS
jgi:D-alanyl-D-alanine carboxypeptidase